MAANRKILLFAYSLARLIESYPSTVDVITTAHSGIGTILPFVPPCTEGFAHLSPLHEALEF